MKLSYFMFLWKKKIVFGYQKSFPDFFFFFEKQKTILKNSGQTYLNFFLPFFP